MRFVSLMIVLGLLVTACGAPGPAENGNTTAAAQATATPTVCPTATPTVIPTTTVTSIGPAGEGAPGGTATMPTPQSGYVPPEGLPTLTAEQIRQREEMMSGVNLPPGPTAQAGAAAATPITGSQTLPGAANPCGGNP